MENAGAFSIGTVYFLLKVVVLESDLMENPDAFLGRLRPIYIFKGLSDDQIREVAEELVVEHAQAGQTLFEQGDEGQDFYIIHRGQAKVTRQRGPKPPEVVATLVPGDFFVGERQCLALTLSADPAEPDCDMAAVDRHFPELARRAADVLKVASLHGDSWCWRREWRLLQGRVRG